MNTSIIGAKEQTKNTKASRIELIDALRGFALLGILLIHGVERFYFFKKPDHYFLFSPEFDQSVMKATFFMISQKAYSIFALMFGVSFYIQMSNHRNKGSNFNRIFLWRLIILFGFGVLHSLLIPGDILIYYAALGIILIPINGLNTKTLWLLAILFALQIPFIYQLFKSVSNPDFEIFKLKALASWKEMGKTYIHGDFFDVIRFNLIKGKSRSVAYTYNSGRFFQLFSLFIVGVILGRKNVFAKLKENINVGVKIMLFSLLIVVGLKIFLNNLSILNLAKDETKLFHTIINSYYNLAFTLCLIIIFSLLYHYYSKGIIFKQLATFGRMSLTNYITQTILGVVFFYGYGFEMYRYAGFTWGLIFAVLIFILQVAFCSYWLKNYHYGPLEWLWRALTYFDFKLKFKVLSLD